MRALLTCVVVAFMPSPVYAQCRGNGQCNVPRVQNSRLVMQLAQNSAASSAAAGASSAASSAGGGAGVGASLQVVPAPQLELQSPQARLRLKAVQPRTDVELVPDLQIEEQEVEVQVEQAPVVMAPPRVVTYRLRMAPQPVATSTMLLATPSYNVQLACGAGACGRSARGIMVPFRRGSVSRSSSRSVTRG